MKLNISVAPYSSIVGGGLILADDSGKVRFTIAIIGATEGITKAESDAICDYLRDGMNQRERSGWPLIVPDRPAPVAPTTTPIQPKISGKHSSCVNEVREYARQNPLEFVLIPRSCKSCGLGPCKKGDRT